MIFEINSVYDAFFEEGAISKSYLDVLVKAGFKLIKAKDELGDLVYKIYISDLSELQLLHKVVNHDLIISFPESKPVPKNTMSVACDIDDDPRILIYDDWIE